MPMLVGTLSGVVIDGGMSVVIFIFGALAAKAVVAASAQRSAAARMFFVFIMVFFLWLIGWLNSPVGLTRTPGFVEERFERAVEAQDDVPAFAGDGLHPVDFMPRRSGRAEVNVHRGVRIDHDSLPLAAHARERAVSLQHR